VNADPARDAGTILGLARHKSDLGRLALTGELHPVVEDINNKRDTGRDFGFSQTGIFVYVSGKGTLAVALLAGQYR
jgi:hypothetical protein